jgi:putative ubiquitin-RnfH superfamily antitoxin RatB of RatAB toxin-antitoxin module
MSEEATIEAALAAARSILGEEAVPWDRAATGIFGKATARDHVWADGDRVELYRPLQLDPRARRRERADGNGRRGGR